ncbi:conserved hypothetical protein [Candidatus Desulfarcum epimagneticum]|uniref:AAA family ATPase n=1 Tax=uncultured Desulfobacteraceae bacterium TaxID=218296 RepID=A0A484HEH8_9BACT|nr:conserved hypothetical protein [uncultured Desulfobacteraceae bacterium]
MLPRTLASPIRRYRRQYPVVAIVGPRQSGKTTLARHLFPGHRYLSMENLDTRHMAEDDPRGFLDDNGGNLILDEIQRVPSIFSYLQERVDFEDSPSSYVLTGSQQFLLMERVTQSLAGRIATYQLYPFTLNELRRARLDRDMDAILQIKTVPGGDGEEEDLCRILFSGMYPRIHDKRLDPEKWIENYILTYVERDIRSLVNISNLKTFETFIKICASMSGQLVNQAAISNAAGISQPTVKKWLSLMEASGIVFFLRPHHRNFKKRLIKTPKLYFVDTGVLSSLLSIRNPGQLKTHPLFGNIFETFIISEFYKRIHHIGERPHLYFWRDRTGNEIDLIIESGSRIIPIEIKSSRTYSPAFKAGLSRWMRLEGNTARKGFVLYRGRETVGKTSDIAALPWRRM